MEAPSPFHSGERELQTRTGVRDKLEPFGRIGIRDHMPEQHMTLFAALRSFFIGSVDGNGRPWASMLTGAPGFVHALDERRLRIEVRRAASDPIASNLGRDASIGGLGIEFHTRRRNRVNGQVTEVGDAGFMIAVEQSFGNCAQYIRARTIDDTRTTIGPDGPRRDLEALDEVCRTLLRQADTAFLASRYGGTSGQALSVDVSHRGGRPGFIRIIDDKTLLLPDYRGNFFFNTLSNLLLDPRCGLTVFDFECGDALQITGRAEVLWEWPYRDAELAGAVRVVVFAIDQILHCRGADPLRWSGGTTAREFDAGIG